MVMWVSGGLCGLCVPVRALSCWREVRGVAAFHLDELHGQSGRRGGARPDETRPDGTDETWRAWFLRSVIPRKTTCVVEGACVVPQRASPTHTEHSTGTMANAAQPVHQIPLEIQQISLLTPTRYTLDVRRAAAQGG